MSRRFLGLPIVLALLGALTAAPALPGEEAALAAPAQEVATPVAPAPVGCGLNLEMIDPAAEVGICPAVAPQEAPAPEFRVGRTCRCSCGQPCKKDADCGPGGLCMGGITCC
jgi:hypothetical protein